MGVGARSPTSIRLQVTLTGEKYTDISAGDSEGTRGGPTWSCRASGAPASQEGWCGEQASGPGKRLLSIFRWNGHSGFAAASWHAEDPSPTNQLAPLVRLGASAGLHQRAGSPPWVCRLPPPGSHLLPAPPMAEAAVCPAAGRSEAICHPSAGLSPLPLPPAAKLGTGGRRNRSREGARRHFTAATE